MVAGFIHKLVKYGVRKADNILKVCDTIKHTGTIYRTEEDKVFLFLKLIINKNGETVAVNKFCTFFEKHPYSSCSLKDAWNMYYKLKQAKFSNLISFNKGFSEIHDDISKLYDKLRLSKRIIKPTETELERQFEKGEYSIRLAEDTDRLIEIGQKMHICVGSYGFAAVKKKTTIYYMLNRASDKYVGCFEVKRNRLIQAKGFSNSLLQGAERGVLEDWVKEKRLSAKNCYDFKTTA